MTKKGQSAKYLRRRAKELENRRTRHQRETLQERQRAARQAQIEPKPAQPGAEPAAQLISVLKQYIQIVGKPVTAMSEMAAGPDEVETMIAEAAKQPVRPVCLLCKLPLTVEDGLPLGPKRERNCHVVSLNGILYPVHVTCPSEGAK